MHRLFIAIAVLCLAALAAGDAVAVAPPQGAVAPVTDEVITSTDAITIPRMLSYQGILTDTLGIPVPNGAYSVSFRLYTMPSGGSPFWSETQNVTTKDGLFAVLLGAVTPIAAMPDGGGAYLGMAVAGEAELAPRLRIVSVAYAYKADTASYALSGGDAAWARADSVLYTIRNLGIARGGAGNGLHFGRFTHVNLGVACTTGTYSETRLYATVSGGYRNSAGGDRATVGGGERNIARGSYATVGGGSENVASSPHATTGGGEANLASGHYAVVAGGWDNTASGSEAVVGGGSENLAGGRSSTVGGGYDNYASGEYSTVGGGNWNAVSGRASTVGGGAENAASEHYATVGGGYDNTANGHSATVGGGWENAASGEAATVPGGRRNAARGSFSLAAGHYARANHRGSFVWSDSSAAASESVYTTAANQFRVRARDGTWFYSNAGMTTGAYLAAGSNAWASACDSLTKEDFREVDRRELLARVAALRVREYKMKDQNDGTRHIGPVAQDFAAAFGYGENNTSINMADADGVLFAAVQALYDKVNAQQAEIDALKAKLAGQK